ncbi:Coenzyme F420 hydrogenase/dehydrogenase, beta subunit C-terminal domain [Methylobacillus methanolivorans]
MINNLQHQPSGSIGTIQSVIEGGYCIGCGSCTAVQDSPVKVVLNEVGKFQAILPAKITSASLNDQLAKVCPFSGAGANEDEIGSELFGDHAQHDDRLGFWQELYVGHVDEEEYRINGSSGGIVSWTICELLAKGEIDGVLHVVPTTYSSGSEVMFHYGVSTSSDEVRSRAKSRYYGVEMSKVLEYVKQHPGRYLVVGVPCFIKSIRLLSTQDPIFAENIKFTIAILCGHLKSIAYLEYIAWQLGVSLNEIERFDFRYKMPNNPATSYAVEIVSNKDNSEKTQSAIMSNLRGGDWGLGLFKYGACDYCDDVMGETADLAAGDAWIEPYKHESFGTSVVIVRNKVLHKFMEAAREANRLRLTTVTPDVAAETQLASFRHRRSGLAYRLYLKQEGGVWAPPKRVTPQFKHLSKKYRKIFKLRAELVAISDAAYIKAIKLGGLEHYWGLIAPYAKKYHRIYHPLWIAIPRKIWRIILKRIKK